MTLAASGNITIAAISTETGESLPLGLTNAKVRRLAGKRTGSVVMPTDFYSKNMANVPDWLDFDNFIASGENGCGISQTRSVTGQTNAITLEFATTNGEINNNTGCSSYIQIDFYKNSSFINYITWNRLTAGQTTGISRSQSITGISPSDTIDIVITFVNFGPAGGSSGASATFVIKNTSSFNNEIGTFVIGVSGTCSGDPGTGENQLEAPP